MFESRYSNQEEIIQLNHISLLHYTNILCRWMVLPLGCIMAIGSVFLWGEKNAITWNWSSEWGATWHWSHNISSISFRLYDVMGWLRNRLNNLDQLYLHGSCSSVDPISTFSLLLEKFSFDASLFVTCIINKSDINESTGWKILVVDLSSVMLTYYQWSHRLVNSDVTWTCHNSGFWFQLLGFVARYWVFLILDSELCSQTLGFVSRFWVFGFRFWVLVLDSGLLVPGFEFWFQILDFWFQVLSFRNNKANLTWSK